MFEEEWRGEEAALPEPLALREDSLHAAGRAGWSLDLAGGGRVMLLLLMMKKKKMMMVMKL